KEPWPCQPWGRFTECRGQSAGERAASLGSPVFEKPTRLCLATAKPAKRGAGSRAAQIRLNAHKVVLLFAPSSAMTILSLPTDTDQQLTIGALMPHSRSAKKNLRKSEKRRAQNRAVKKSIKTQIKRVLEVAKTDALDVLRKEYNLAAKRLDKAAARRIV